MRVRVRVRVRIPPGLEVDLAASVQRGRVPRADLEGLVRGGERGVGLGAFAEQLAGGDEDEARGKQSVDRKPEAGEAIDGGAGLLALLAHAPRAVRPGQG